MLKQLLFLSVCVGIALGQAKGPTRKEEQPPPLDKQLKPEDLPTLTPLQTTRDTNVVCVPGEVDLYFVVDSSGSIGSSNFATVLQFLENVVNRLKVDSTHSRVGVVEFNVYADLIFPLNRYFNTSTIDFGIERIQYTSGGTNIAAGMNLAITTGFTGVDGDRPEVPDVMIVLTDGQDGGIIQVREAYNAARAKNITVIAVGVGSGVNPEELNAIAGDNPQYVFSVNTFNNLSSITGSICREIGPAVNESDPCLSNPCGSLGTCLPNGTTYSCLCQAGYYGNGCELPVCQNGGQFHCSCPFGYTGPTCGDVIDFCNETRIMHDGTETHIPLCGPHGVCRNSANGASCVCNADWTGTFCDQNIDDCQPNPCKNGGTCIDNPTVPGYTCECDRLHQGSNCEQNIDFCKDLEILQNGTVVSVPVCEHGVCQNTADGAMCQCQDDEYNSYSGQFCEMEKPKNCIYKGETYPHNSTWVDKCDSCACIFGQVECADTQWCPQRCALYHTTLVDQHNISTSCPPNQNCIPEDVACAKPTCSYPVGWCFPVGMVIVDQINLPTIKPVGPKKV